MKRVMASVIMLLAAQAAYGFECHECHSKNPAMVKMHKALEGKWCFDCHKMGEKLMGKGVPKDKASQLQRRVSDPLCVGCHKKQ
jgi:hypothetical protein